MTFYREEIITPAIAETLLLKNTRNRPIKTSQIVYYAKCMDEGEWVLNTSDAISITPEGELLNGQHRLLAVIKCGKPQAFLVARHADPEQFSIMDTGIRRGGSDVLAILGEKNAAALAAALGWQFRYELALEAPVYRILRAHRNAFTHNHLIALLAAHPHIRESLTFVDTIINPRRLLPISVAAWAHYHLSKINHEKADAFFEAFGSGENISKGTPVFALRRKLEERMLSRAKIWPEDLLALVVKAWNAYITERTMIHLYWNADTEPYPVARGPLLRVAGAGTRATE